MGFAVGHTRRRALLVWLPAAACLALFALAYFSAQHNAIGSDCSECSQTLGRYWEPQWVTFEAIAITFLWGVGAGAGALARWLMGRHRAAV